ncbi:MAG TPA: Gfo/Idh/MocA family oxidoreductase [bacterium]|nr:Gfo/Idh/MocA family oxidoreductase [bacterium]
MARPLGVAVLGYTGVARAHLTAVRRQAELFPDAPAPLRLVALCGRTRDAVEEAGRRYGAERAATAWQALVDDPAVDVLINAAPNDLHLAPSVAALRAGKAVLCEKPLGRTAREAAEMARAARADGRVAMTGFNYRFMPAVLLARRMVESGELGRLYHFRCRYSDDSLVDPRAPWGWRHDRERAGSGVIGDLAAHPLDLALVLAGPVTAVTAATRTFVTGRPRGATPAPVTVEDAVVATLEFESGAVGTLEASGMCPGRKNLFTFELNGERGTAVWDLERLNELRVYHGDGDARGLADVLVTERTHPYGGRWWPPGHTLGWESGFVHQIEELARRIAGAGGPMAGATFADGLACALVCDALLTAAETGRRISVPPLPEALRPSPPER